VCGIVGYIGAKEASPILLESLGRLEYRGYDSAGIAVISNGDLFLRKRLGKLSVLNASLTEKPISSNCGIGHTRWATHGEPNEKNAHPHSDCTNSFAVVHNGIIENYASLKTNLLKRHHKFKSQTDTEVIIHLIEENYKGDLVNALKKTLKKIKGTYAIAVISNRHPEEILAARCGSPLIIGVGKGENFIASDVPAILNRTQRIIYLDDYEIAHISKDSIKILNLEGKILKKKAERIKWDIDSVTKGGFAHFMLKEIHEQPKVVKNILKRRISNKEITFEELKIKDTYLKKIKRIIITACGTAWHAGLVGKYLLEKFTRLPVWVDLSSEFRYCNPIIDKNTLVIAVTQSGETADTLASIRLAKERKAKVLSICNVVGSSIARDSDGIIYTHAGPEIGVASTKAYTAQIVIFFLFALYLGVLRKALKKPEVKIYLNRLKRIPRLMEEILKNKKIILRCARKYNQAKNFMYLGRNINFPNALEGALKLKEISYVHAEGFGAGEMKHGPIALVDRELPVVCIIPTSSVYEKMISNIQEIRARCGIIISIATEGDYQIKKYSNYVIYIPKSEELISSVLVAIPLQLLAYYIAVENGCDVDKPRNLAKSVTVE
jgi:glucosamine--fructose-6-phosphate aminotransferase (isomerizing)